MIKKERIEVYRAAKRKYKEMIRKDLEGTTPLYREKTYRKIERAEEKEKKKKSWFETGNEEAEAVFFVKATPEGKLAEACQKELRKANLKIKVIEKSGRSIKNCLVKSCIGHSWYLSNDMQFFVFGVPIVLLMAK